MNEIYAMRRANGDWFALEGHGRLRVPLFHSSHDAVMAALRTFGMLLFKPVALDARLLKEMVPVGNGRDVDFCLVNNPLASLSRGSLLEHTEVASLIRNGNGFRATGSGTPSQSEWWN